MKNNNINNYTFECPINDYYCNYFDNGSCYINKDNIDKVKNCDALKEKSFLQNNNLFNKENSATN